MEKKLKKGNLIFLVTIFLFFIGYLFGGDITGKLVMDTNIATESDIELYEKAIETSDEMLCSKIDFKDFKDDCLVKVANEKVDQTICELILDEKMQFSCYSDISRLTNDVELCKMVETDEYWNTICYKNYAIGNNNSDYCWFIPKGEQNNPCFYEVAVKTLDWEACHDITDTTLYNKCNHIISQRALRIEPCLQLNNLVDRDSCVIRLARKSDDVKICEEIKIEGIKEDCFDRFKEE